LSEERFLNLFRDRFYLRLALAGALAAAFTLGACGRKGPLDPPPGASLTGEQGATAVGPDGKPVPQGPKKRIPLDVLLN
jgi:predicted small lipoprotein YifL